jgi:hypothetical protein
MKNIFLTLFFILGAGVSSFAQTNGLTNSATNQPGWSGSKNFVKNPDCAKNTSNITASGGSLTRSTTTPINGDAGAECLIDASSSAQTYCWSLNTFDQGMKGQNCEARFHFEGDATLYKAYVKNGSSQITSDLTLTYNSSAVTPVSINFPCGDLSASNTMCVESTSASAAAISVGRVYAGLATNLGLANPISDWSGYTPTLTGFGTASSVSFKSRRVGDTLEVIGSLVSGTSTATEARATLGYGGVSGNVTIDTAKIPTNSVIGSGALNVSSTTYFALYPLATGANSYLAFSVQNSTANALTAQNASTIIGSGQTLQFHAIVPIVGWGSQQALSSNNTPWYVDAIIYGANLTLDTTAVATAKEMGDAGLTMAVGTGSAAAGIMCAGTNAATSPSTSTTTCAAGNEVLGFNASFPVAGSYEICFEYNHYMSADSNEALDTYFRIDETATTCAANPCTSTQAISGGLHKTNSMLQGMTIATGTASIVQHPIKQCETFNISSAGIHGYRLMYNLAIGGTPNAHLITADGGNGGRNVHITVRPVTNQQPQPLLVGSVTSNSSGMERVERAEITPANSGSCTIISQSGSWITSCTATAAGDCSCVLDATKWSTRPSCTFSSSDASSATTVLVSARGTSSSTSAMAFKTSYVSNGSSTVGPTNSTVIVLCQGPR